MMIPDWIWPAMIAYIAIIVLCEFFGPSSSCEADLKRMDRLQEKLQEADRKLQQLNTKPSSENYIKNTGKSILFEEMCEMHKNRELKDLNEEEDFIDKMLRDAGSRE